MSRPQIQHEGRVWQGTRRSSREKLGPCTAAGQGLCIASLLYSHSPRRSARGCLSRISYQRFSKNDERVYLLFLPLVAKELDRVLITAQYILNVVCTLLH